MDEDSEITQQQNKKGQKTKGKKYHGMLEWILDREGHEFLIQVDRQFIKDKINLIDLKEKFIKELNVKDDEIFDKRFK